MKSLKKAKKTAEKIKYNVKIENNNLILDNYWITELTNKKHDQEVELFLYLPKVFFFLYQEKFNLSKSINALNDVFCSFFLPAGRFAFSAQKGDWWYRKIRVVRIRRFDSISVTSKKLPNVHKSCPKMISLEQ